MTANWYVVNVYSGFENKVVEVVRERAKRQGVSDLFEEMLVPTEKVIAVQRGRKTETDQKLFPGYVLVKVNLTDQAYRILRTTPKVTGLLGANNKPLAISEEEAMHVLQRASSEMKPPRASVPFEVGEQVCVADGPFASFNGVVEAVDDVRLRLKVAVSIFGRATPVELEYSQVEKL